MTGILWKVESEGKHLMEFISELHEQLHFYVSKGIAIFHKT